MAVLAESFVFFIYCIFIVYILVLPFPKIEKIVSSFFKKNVDLSQQLFGLNVNWDMFCWGKLSLAIRCKVMMTTSSGQWVKYDIADYEFLRWFAYLLNNQHIAKKMALHTAKWLLKKKGNEDFVAVKIVYCISRRPIASSKLLSQFSMSTSSKEIELVNFWREA